MFDSLNFEQLNETDVREEVITPLLRQLGYRSGTAANIIREQLLRYPKHFLGRKNPKADPELRGKADYILEVDEGVRWVIEAKAPNCTLDCNEIEQAWSYASHPEVRAVYFVLCNGRQLQVFQTDQSPVAEPLLEVAYEELDEKWTTLANLLDPAAVTADHPRQDIVVGPALGENLRSVARITNGVITYENNTMGARALNELQLSVLSGAVERDDDGRLTVFLRTIGPSRSLQELNERLGLSDFEMLSTDNVLSSDASRPTVFKYSDQLILPAGEEILDITQWRKIHLPQNLRCDTNATAEGVLNDRIFAGHFENRIVYQGGVEVGLSGKFSIHLA